MDGISVIVCCYNSAARLPETIKHLAFQIIPSTISWEIIIVNNASTDGTNYAAKLEWAKYDLPSVGFRIVDENMPGLSNARGRGVNEAKFEIIVFCDDDNWLKEDYLVVAHKLISENPTYGAVGGQSDFVSDIELVPEWFYENKDEYAVGKQAKFSGFVTERGFLFGSGLTMRRKNFHAAFKGFQSLLSDRKGIELGSGGDSEICLRLILMGLELYYDEDLRFTHFIPKERLTLNYFSRVKFGFAQAANKLWFYRRVHQLSNINSYKAFAILVASLTRLVFINLGIKKEWSSNHEWTTVSYLTSFKISSSFPEIKKISIWHGQVKKLSKPLSGKLNTKKL